MFVSVSEFFYKKNSEIICFFDFPPPLYLQKNYQRNDNECNNS